MEVDMIYQKPNPYPTNEEWWIEKFFGITRAGWFSFFIAAVLITCFCFTDWDWVFGLR